MRPSRLLPLSLEIRGGREKTEFADGFYFASRHKIDTEGKQWAEAGIYLLQGQLQAYSAPASESPLLTRLFLEILAVYIGNMVSWVGGSGGNLPRNSWEGWADGEGTRGRKAHVPRSPCANPVSAPREPATYKGAQVLVPPGGGGRVLQAGGEIGVGTELGQREREGHKRKGCRQGGASWRVWDANLRCPCGRRV